MFCLSLAADFLEGEFKRELIKMVVKNINGTTSRRILFAATALNFGVDLDVLKKFVKIEEVPDRIEDIIAFLWFLKSIEIILNLIRKQQNVG